MNAEEAIGHAEGGDYVLAPAEHAQRLPPEAGPLKRVLQRPPIAVVVNRYNRADQEAATAQAVYKTRARGAIHASSAAVLAGALLLYARSNSEAEPWMTALAEVIRFPLHFIQTLAVVATAYLTYFLREADPLTRWMNKRAEAEMARIALFEGVCSVTSEVQEEPRNIGEIPLLPLQLEYFRRYQLEVEINFYDLRGKAHEAAANRLVTWGGFVTALFALATAAAGLFGEIGYSPAAALLLLVAPVAIATHNNHKLLDQNRQNAIRYANTLEKLRTWQAKLDNVREAVESGSRGALVEFVKGVNNEISLEHREWLTSKQEAAQPALDLSRSSAGGAVS